MFILYADKNQLTVRRREPITSGSMNAYTVQFSFSPDWDGLTRTAVFRYDVGGYTPLYVRLDEDNSCRIPWEVMERHGQKLYAGVLGRRGGELVLPTIWASLGTVLEGVEPGEDARPPTPELWQQELDRKGDKLDYTPDGDLGLYAGDKLLSAVPVTSGGGGEGGTADHRLLHHRDAEEQHPISSISGLEEQLKTIPRPVEPLKNEDLEAILK